MVQDLSARLNCLPTACLPSWSVDITEAEVRQDASDIGRSEDHGNCAASALLLALLRPQMFGMTHMPPLRIFGVPPPRNLLKPDFAPRSGQGPDNFRGNIIEGLTMHLARLSATSAAAAEAHLLLQETWVMFRTRVEMVKLTLHLQEPLQAWKIVSAVLSVPDHILFD